MTAEGNAAQCLRLTGEMGPSEELLIHLRWQQPAPPKKKRFYTRKARPIELEFGCLFELEGGEKGCVQALGNACGALEEPPYILLECKARGGKPSGLETLRIRGGMLPHVKRLLFFSFVFEGAPNWRDARAQLQLRCPGSEELLVAMDGYESTQKLCSIALFEQKGGGVFELTPALRFFDGHSKMDQDFGWGLRWTPGRR